MTTPPTPAGWYPDPDDERKKALRVFAGLTGVLLVFLIAAIAYAVFVNESESIGMNGSDVSSSAPSTPSAGGIVGEPSTASPTDESPTESPAAAGGDAVDGPLTFVVHGIQVEPTVTMSNAPVQKTANGEYDVVHLTVTNTGSESAAFVASYQKLNAGGQVYTIDDQATAYLEGTFTDLQPGASADVSIAFDVPSGTEAESVELHTDPMTPGVVVPFG
jgi:hypothetical protein